MQHRFASRDEMKHFYGWIMVGVGIVVTCIGQGAVLSLGFRGGRLRVHPGHGTRAVGRWPAVRRLRQLLLAVYRLVWDRPRGGGHCMHVQPTPQLPAVLPSPALREQ
jgi:hypothetical protein